MDNHIIALNAHDEDALAQTLHFPHIRLSANDMKLWPTAESYFLDFKKGQVAIGIIQPLMTLKC